MSSINSSDRGNDDQVRRARENYQTRESESNKKQGQQIKKITEAHQAEIEELKASHARQLEELKSKTREAMSRRDMQYQKDIDDLRDMHQKQIQRMAYDTELRQGRNESALKEEIGRVERTNERQKEILTTNFGEQMREKDARMEEHAKNSIRLQQEAGDRTKQNLTRAHEKEMTTVIKDRDERLLAQQRGSDSMRRSKDQELDRLDRQRRNDNDRLYSQLEVGVKNERENNRMAQEIQQQTFNNDMRRMRDRYETASEKMRHDTETFRGELSDTVTERLNDRVNALESNKGRLQDDNTRQRTKMEHEKAIELSNLRDSMQANINKLEQDRRDTVDASNAKTKQEIDHINSKNTEVLHGSNKFYQDKMAMDQLRNDERFSQQKTDSSKLLIQEKTTGQARFDKLKNNSDLEQGKMRGYFERASQSMKENFETTLRDMRDRSRREQEQLFSQFAKTAQENDAKFQQKIADLGVKYERQLAEVQETHMKELKEQQLVADRQKGELTKKSDMDMKTQASQYEYRIGKLEDTHKREIEHLNRKHEESLANLIKTRQA